MKRSASGVLLLGTVMLGLATRRMPHAFPGVVARYGGDTLWAMMIVWILVLAWPQMRSAVLGLVALAICLAVEVSQLHHAGWIDVVRATRAGALALGHGFLWSDLLCYAIGVLLAVVLRHLALEARVAAAAGT